MTTILKFGKKSNSNAVKEGSAAEVPQPQAGATFEDIVRRNLENAERVKKERERANKNVLRSYRIK